jgi:hypothetical protein
MFRGFSFKNEKSLSKVIDDESNVIRLTKDSHGAIVVVESLTSLLKPLIIDQYVTLYIKTNITISGGCTNNGTIIIGKDNNTTVTLNIKSRFTNNGVVINKGILLIIEGGIVTNASSALIQNMGMMDIDFSGSVENNGLINNAKKITNRGKIFTVNEKSSGVFNSDTGKFTNNGLFTEDYDRYSEK